MASDEVSRHAEHQVTSTAEKHNTHDTRFFRGPDGGNNGNDETRNPLADLIEDDTPYTIFSPGTKIFLVCMTVFATLFSPFSSFIYLPAITPIAEEYGRSIAEINLTVTLYQVMQAISPLFFGDLSDRLGRRPVYMLTFTIYMAANIGLALQNNYGALMVLRALQSTGSSATVAIGNAVMADFTTPADRGGYISAVQSCIMFAPALAPVLGGILTQFMGWRSTFWFLVIAAGVFLAVYLPFVPEVCLFIFESKGIMTDFRTDGPQDCWEWITASSKAQHVPNVDHPEISGKTARSRDGE